MHSALLVGLYVAVRLALPAAAADVSPEASCAAGDSLLAARLVELAEGEYKKAVTHPCGRGGMARVQQQRCEKAVWLASVGDVERAKRHYDALLTASSDFVCLSAVHTAIQRAGATESKFAIAIMMDSLGYKQKAWELFSEAVTDNPHDAPREAFYIRRYLLQADESWKHYLSPVLATLVTLFAAGVALVLGLSAFAARRRLKMDVGLVSRGVVDVPGEVPEALGARIEYELRHLDDQRRPRHPSVIDAGPADQAPAVPLTTLPPHVSAVVATLTHLLPNNTLTLTATLQVKPGRGAGLLLRLLHQKDRTIVVSEEVWQDEVQGAPPPALPAASDYLELAQTAALWASWHAGRYAQRRPDRRARLRLRFRYGTPDWQSYLALQRATRLKSEGAAPERVRSLLNRAVAVDPENRIALFNLALSDVEAASRALVGGAGPAFDRPVRYFHRVMELSEQLRHTLSALETEPPEEDQPFVYAAYQLGAIALYRYLQRDTSPALLFSAQRYLQQALTAAEGLGDRAAGLRAIISLVREAAELLAHPARVHQIVGRVDATVHRQQEVGSEFRYNLACFYSTAAAVAEAGSEAAWSCARKGFEQLEYAIWSKGDYRQWAAVDPSLRALRETDRARFDALVAP